LIRSSRRKGWGLGLFRLKLKLVFTELRQFVALVDRTAFPSEKHARAAKLADVGIRSDSD